MLKFFRAPLLYKDDEQQNKLELLNVILLTGLGSALGLAVFFVVFSPSLPVLLLLLGLALLCAVLRKLTFRWPLRKVSRWTALSLWAAYTIGFALVPEVRPIVSEGYFIVVMVAALLLPPRYSMGITMLSLLTLGVLINLWQGDVFHLDAVNAPLYHWLGIVFGLISLWFTLVASVHVLGKALARARSELQHREQMEKELRQQTEYLTALHETTLQIINRLESHSLLQSILHRACQIAATEHGLIELVLPAEIEMRQELGHGIFEQFNGFHVARGEGLTGKVWHLGEPMQITDYAHWVGASAPYRAAGICSVVGVPLKLGERVLGVLALAHTQPDESFDHRQVELLRQFANMAALALENARLYQKAQDEIEERKRVEAQLRELNAGLETRVHARTAELEAANQELESFSYSVSHDLRAPLRAITGYSRILGEDFASQLPREAQGFVLRLQEQSERMGHLIEDLLAFSRTSRQTLRRDTVDLADLANQVYQDLRESAGDETRQVEFTVDALPTLQVDRGMFRQVMQNLLGNALKYTRQRQKTRIEIGMTCQEGQDVFFVRDNGAGFDMQFADRLFGVFQRLHRDDEFEGTGVGLAIVQRIINRHGGKIWAEAEVGLGATFYFTVGSG